MDQNKETNSENEQTSQQKVETNQKVDDLLDHLVNAISNIEISDKKKSAYSGTSPNTKWKAVPLDDLYKHERFIRTEDTIQQRSQEWFDLRKGKLTGSQFSNALGFFDQLSCKKLQLKPIRTYHHPERVFVVYNEILQIVPTVEDNFSSPRRRIFMDWGIHHENNAVLTYLNEFTDHHIKETTFHVVDDLETYIRTHCDINDFAFVTDFKDVKIGASPDGIVMIDGIESSVLEIKCPTAFVPDGKIANQFNYLRRKPHDSVPVYYIPQLMGEMLVTKLPKCTFCSWTITSGMNVFEISFNQAYVNEMLYWFYRYMHHIKNSGPLDSSNLSIFEGIFIQEERYLKFLEWSLEISRSAILVCKIEKSVVSNLNQKIFLD